MQTKPKLPIDLLKVEELASRGLTQEQIAASLGLSVRTLQRRKKDLEGVEKAINQGRAKGLAEIANRLYQKALEGDNTCMIFYLKAQGGWSEKSQVELSGNKEEPVVFENIFIDDLKD